LVTAVLNQPIDRFLGRLRKKRKSNSAPMSKRAQTLLRQQLADGPKAQASIEAAAEVAEIPKRSLMAAAEALGVLKVRGQCWRLPG
jgi:hypothetical protein